MTNLKLQEKYSKLLGTAIRFEGSLIMKVQVFLVALLLLVSTSVNAVEFGPNSANISNPYFPAKIGDWKFSQGVGNNWNFRIFYIDIIGTETVSGAQIGAQVFNNVKCIKANIAITDDGGSYEHEFFTFSMAQDTDGNVWVLKIYSHMANVTILLGGPFFKSMFMPAVPAVGQPAGIKMPEDSNNYCRIVEVGIPLVTTSFDTYENCIKVNCYDEDPSDIEVEHYCPGFGIVHQSNESSPGDVLDLKAYGTTTVKRTVVIPLID